MPSPASTAIFFSTPIARRRRGMPWKGDLRAGGEEEEEEEHQGKATWEVRCGVPLRGMPKLWYDKTSPLAQRLRAGGEEEGEHQDKAMWK